MLVLGRKIGEEIMIGEDTRLIVLEVRGSTVRLGFVAPREVPIHRAETQRKIDESGELHEMVISRDSPALLHARAR